MLSASSANPMLGIPDQDGVQEYQDSAGDHVKITRTTELTENDEETIETITVVTKAVSKSETRLTTVTVITTTNKATGNKTIKKKKTTSLTKRETTDDEDEVEVQIGSLLQKANLKTTNLIFGIDFTKSNQWNGRSCFDGKSLHHVEEGKENPYQYVLRVVGESLEELTGDHEIPAFGFGDAKTHARRVFPFFEDDDGGKGYLAVLKRYTEIAQEIELGGPTTNATIIRKAIEITKEVGGHHTLLIITDDTVDESKIVDTRKAIEEAEEVPLSIVIVGVGDAQWIPGTDWREWPSQKRGRVGKKCYWKLGTEIVEEKVPKDFKAHMNKDHTPHYLYWTDKDGVSRKYTHVSFVSLRQLFFKGYDDDAVKVAILSSLAKHESLMKKKEIHTVEEHYRNHDEILAERFEREEEAERLRKLELGINSDDDEAEEVVEGN
eukprot:TRINITY_DN1048_c0_g1_i2.p1 TRINITY_DN1048_c0_g1~~TRINITY_DN1048_c0_g1_i2.p1  ORF type:complete len:436 (-),score=104.80 TRINITY_DN1048_c0_g1_i2:38-1345(-)